MCIRDKRIGPYSYVYLAENVLEDGPTKQRVVANLGRKEVVLAQNPNATHKQQLQGLFEVMLKSNYYAGKLAVAYFFAAAPNANELDWLLPAVTPPRPDPPSPPPPLPRAQTPQP